MGQLEQAKLGKWDVYLHNQGEITSILLTNPTDDSGLIRQYKEKTETVADLFTQEYEIDYTNWTGKTELFSNFGEIIKKYNITDETWKQEGLCKNCINDVFQSISKL